MTTIRCQGLSKSFGPTAALRAVDLDVAAGEMFFLLGPSGCGKSTLLRLLAGLSEPSAGRIFFNDRDVTSHPTERRNAVMVFQSYALWPHMTVRENVGFGLEIRARSQGTSRGQRDEQVNEVLRLVQLDALANRRPGQLSGGQQQRVALARALAVRPDCLLLDEPLSNLDAHLRLEMLGEIRRICKSAGLTAIYVTHDQKEALSTADRIAVMRAGKIEQTGTPAELYNRAINGFVAGFVAPTNLLSGKVVGGDNGVVQVETAGGLVRGVRGAASLPQNVVVSIRPDRLRVIGNNSASGVGLLGNRLSGPVIESRFLGSAGEYVIDVGGVRLAAVVSPPLAEVPPELSFGFEPADAWVVAE